MRGATQQLRAGCLAAALLAAGCMSPVKVSDDGYRHRRHDYDIAAPDGPGGPWERVSLEGAPLAFRRAGPQSLSLQSGCGRPVAEPQLMARHLMMGLDERELVASGPVVVDGRNGWTQTFDTAQAGVPVRVKTVTLVVSDCTFDWVLAVSGPFESAEQAFDAWWATFRLDPRRWEGVE